MTTRPSTPPVPADTTPAPRRAPSQRRSRERVERLLVAATKLIEERGSDVMRMSEVAETAGVPIGSLYQYFPDKAALIRTLAERFNAIGRTCVEDALATVRGEEDLPVALEQIIDGYYEMFVAEPVMRDIWSGTQADKALQELSAAEGDVLAAMLLAVLLRLRPDADGAALATKTRLMMELTEATMRLAISVDRAEGDAFVALFRRIFVRELTAA